MKPKVYLETTVISYLTARLSRDMIVAGHQQITQDWWDRRRSEFDVFVSQMVVQEVGAGDPDAAARRLASMEHLPLLDLTEPVLALAQEFLRRGAVPADAEEDAVHVAAATVHGMDYLLTWNCAHIANAQMRYILAELCFEQGYELPVICTPEELLGE